MAKRKKKKGDKVDCTNFITAIINLIIALSMLIDNILDKGN